MLSATQTFNWQSVPGSKTAERVARHQQYLCEHSHFKVKGLVLIPVMMPWHENTFHMTGPLWGETLWPVMRDFGVLFVISLNKVLNKQWRCRWFGTLWFSCVVRVMLFHVSVQEWSWRLNVFYLGEVEKQNMIPDWSYWPEFQLQHNITVFPNDSAKISLIHSCSCLYYISCGCKNPVKFPLVYQLSWVSPDVWNKWTPFFLIKPTSPEKQSLSFVKRSSYTIATVNSIMSCIGYD